MRQLDSGFERTCVALKILMVQSEHDRPTASVLMRNRMTFAFGVMTVRLQLVFYRYGIGTADVTGLVKLLTARGLNWGHLCRLSLGRELKGTSLRVPS